MSIGDNWGTLTLGVGVGSGSDSSSNSLKQWCKAVSV